MVQVAGREVKVTNPGKVFFPARGETKLDLVQHYLLVGEGALRGVHRRPTVLKRFPDGATGEMFFQKRVPAKRPEWLQTAVVAFPSGRTAEELCPADLAHVIWAVNLGCLDLNPHAVRAEDLDHPDELRVDLDPMPGVDWSQIVDVAFVAREVLQDVGLTGWPKTSGSRGLHILVRIEPRWGFADVRLAAETLAREVENRPLPDARVSTPLDWDEVRSRRPEEFTVPTVLQRFAERGDPHAGIDAEAGSLDGLLALAAKLGPAEKPPRSGDGAGRRVSTMPLIEVARTKTKPEAMDALERWKAANPAAAALLHPADELDDGMRGSSSQWYRVRINLQHVPEPDRPAQGPLLADYDPWAPR